MTRYARPLLTLEELHHILDDMDDATRDVPPEDLAAPHRAITRKLKGAIKGLRTSPLRNGHQPLPTEETAHG